MPYRKVPIVAGETYHVFNRSIAQLPIFLDKKEYERFISVLKFYRFKDPKIRFSYFIRLSVDERQKLLNELMQKQDKLVEVYAYCLMPNHFHLLLLEHQTGGITDFIRKVQNSYAKYFNTKSSRSGAVFQSQFKAVRIETDEQLLHVCRYIHLNPVTAYLINDISQLGKYLWSSYADYIANTNTSFVNTKIILNQFSSRKKFKEFICNQVNFQRELSMIKYLVLE